MRPEQSKPFLFKWLRRGAIILVSMVLVLCGSGLFLLATAPGRAITASLIGQLASSPEQRIELEGLNSVLGMVHLERLSLSDKNGVWLKARNFKARYALKDLLGLAISAEAISLSELHLARLPQNPDNTDPSQGSRLPDIPALRAQIKQVSVDRIALGEAVLGKAADLTLQGNLALDDTPLTLTGQLEARFLDGNEGYMKARWDFRPDQNHRRVELDLSEPRGGLIARLMAMETLPAIDLSIIGNGPASQWQSSLALALDGEDMVKGQMQVRLSEEAQRMEAVLSGRLAPFVPKSLLPLVAGDNRLAFLIERKGDSYSLPHFAFRSALASLEAAGKADLADRSLDLSATFLLGDQETDIAFEQKDGETTYLGPVSMRLGLKGLLEKSRLDLNARMPRLKRGSLSVANAQLQASSSAFDILAVSGPVSTKLSLGAVKTGTAELDGLLTGGLQAVLKGAVQSSGLVIEEAKVNSDRLQLTGRGSVTEERLDLNGLLELEALASIDPMLTGSLASRFKLAGTTEDPELSLTVTGDGLAVDDKPIDDLELLVTASMRPEANMSLSGHYDGAPLAASGKLTARPDGRYQISNFALQAPGALLSGEVFIAPNGLAKGIVEADLAEFAKFSPLLLQPDLQGSLKGSIRLGADGGRQTISITARAPRLSVADLMISDLAIAADLIDPTGTASVKADLDVGSLRAGGERLRQLALNINGRAGLLPFTLRGEMSDAPLSASGTLVQTADRTALDLQSFSGRWNRIRLALTRPVQIGLKTGVKLETPLTLAVDDGRVRMQGSVSNPLDLSVALQGLPLSIIEKVAPTGEAVTGFADLDARVTGSPDAPSIVWRGKLAGLSAKSTRDAGLPVFAIATQGQMQRDVITSSNGISGGGAKLDVSGSVSLPGQNLDMSAKGNIPFSLAAKLLADAGLRLDGTADLSLDITGPTNKPVINGVLSTNAARFVELSSGIVVQDLSGSVTLADQRATLNGFTGRFGQSGTLSIGGIVGIDPDQDLPANITLAIRNGSFRHEELLTSQFDATLALDGQLMGRSTISGRIDLDRTEIAIPDTLPDAISPVSVQHKNAVGKVAEQAEKLQPRKQSEASGPAIALDLAIASPGRIYVRGRGMDAELGGTIQITGTTASPNPVGSVSMIRGRMDILTRRLDFDTGSVTFAGTLDPALDFRANLTRGGATYGLAVAGYASAPEVSLFSSPQLPEDEILAQIFFDRDLASLSPLQLAQLANAVATLSGVNSGPGVIDRLRSLAGIDNVDIQSDAETGETTVGVGSYLNERTYVNVERGTSSEKGKVTIDLGITDQLKARGEADTSGNSKAGIFFERDY